MAAYSFLAVKRKDQEYRGQLAIMMLRDAEPKVIQKQMDDWEKDA